MANHCKNCGENLENPKLIRCSNECLFTVICDTRSVNGTLAETWRNY